MSNFFRKPLTTEFRAQMQKSVFFTNELLDERGIVILSSAKNPSFNHKQMDCHVATLLAMTNSITVDGMDRISISFHG